MLTSHTKVEEKKVQVCNRVGQKDELIDGNQRCQTSGPNPLPILMNLESRCQIFIIVMATNRKTDTPGKKSSVCPLGGTIEHYKADYCQKSVTDAVNTSV